MYAAIVEKNGAFKLRSKWYATADEVLAGLATFLKSHIGVSYTVTLISGKQENNGLGF